MTGGRGTRALIAGAGIGGLAAAIALRQAGVEALVFEQARELREIGAGLTLWPNAGRALARLGLAEAVAARGAVITSSRLRASRGASLADLPIADLARAAGAPMLAVHRADLQAVLLGALPPGTVRPGARCRGFRQAGGTVAIRLADGTEVGGDLLVGADGVGSVVRAGLFGAGPPRYAGYAAWRGIAAPAPPGARPGGAFETWGCGTRFGAVPIGGGRVYWFATANVPAGTQHEPAARRPTLQALFADWHDPIPALIAATAAAAILYNDIVDRPPLPRWSRGRVTLLGDAAHAMTPNLGQGAGQALVDAVVLAQCLAAARSVPAALRQYEAQRRPPANRLARLSWWLGWVGQWDHPLACCLRDALLRQTPPGVQRRQLRQVLGLPQ